MLLEVEWIGKRVRMDVIRVVRRFIEFGEGGGYL